MRFTYATREVRVVFASGALDSLATELDLLGVSRAMVVTTPGRARESERLEDILGARLVRIHAKAVQHVPIETVRHAMTAVAESSPDVCVALGGGSAIGLGKAIARDSGLPLVAIPTTYSGSEMTAIWGMSEGGEKRTGRDPRVAPKVVIYDPDLTLALPVAVSAASGMNAVAHAVEALYAADANPVSTLLAADALRRLARSLPRIVQSAHDANARAEALAGAHLAGRALDLTSMGLHHKLCHILGGMGMPHAETHAALLPHVVAYNERAAPAAMATIAEALGASRAASGVVALSQAIGTARPLAELGLSAEQAARATKAACAAKYPNPAQVIEAQVLAMLERARVAAVPETA